LSVNDLERNLGVGALSRRGKYFTAHPKTL
jgi:hypothetical protein